jgi:hypothetical protein
LVVIREELRGAGIDLSCTWVPVEAVVLPQVPYTWERTADGRNVSRPRPGRALLQLDALDPNARVGVEFISREDFDNIDGPWHNVQSSVIEYDFRKVARLVAHRARGKPCGLYLGVFYDPLTGAKHEFGYTPAEEAEITWAQASGDRDALGRAVQSAREEQKARWNENDRQVRLEAERLLREQVKDFIDWLKAQGAI